MTEFQSIGSIANKVVDPWRWWTEALAHPELIGGVALRVHESEPQQGYFRVRKKDSPWEPVAFFYPENSDTMIAYRSGKEVRDINALWTFACRNPISYEAYEKAMDGKGFADEPKAAPGIGDNSETADDYEKLRIEYLGEKEMAEEFLKKPVATQDDADRAAIWAKRLSDITKRAEEFHGIEKRPHLDAGRAVDERWRELKEEPKALSTKLKRSIDTFAAEQRRIEEARARKAREEEEALRIAAQKKIDEAKAAAEESRYKSDIADFFGEPSPATVELAEKAMAEAKALQDAADLKAKESVAQNFQAGRTGAKVATRTFKSAVIEDYDILLMALKDRDEVKELVQSLANRAAKADFKLPGMRIHSEEKVV